MAGSLRRARWKLAGADNPSGALPGWNRGWGAENNRNSFQKTLGRRKNMLFTEIYRLFRKIFLTISRESLKVCVRGGTTA
jgi:hypothetical protein